MSAMKLYRVVFDSQRHHIEAESFEDALAVWSNYCAALSLQDPDSGWDGNEVPESVFMIDDEPVIRRVVGARKEVDLLPCPFCGKPPVEDSGHIRCQDTDCPTVFVADGSRERWNRRPGGAS